MERKIVVMPRRRYFRSLALAAVLGVAAGACVTAAVEHAEAVAAEVETLLGTEQAGKWGDDSKVALSTLCHAVNQGKFHEKELCDCLVVESEKRIDEQAFQEWFMSGGQLRADEVVPLGREAEKVCRDRLGSI